MKKFRQIATKVGAVTLASAIAVTALPYADGTKAVTEEAKAANNYELVNDMQNSAILHCWNWSYSTIEEHMEMIAQAGYSAIQTSPAQQPKDYTYDGKVSNTVGIPKVSGSGNWWKLYQPVTFSVCDNGQTWLGTKDELTHMCEVAEQYGIKVIVDVVANHMGNITGWQNSLSDVSPQIGEYWNKDMLTDESYWHINKHQCWMSDSRLHFTMGSIGMPDLNTGDKRVQGYVANYLDELIDCGVDGFRFDAAKHIETPTDDSDIASDFWPVVLGEAKSHYKSVTGGNLYVYGEILNTVGDNYDISGYTKYMSVTDNNAGDKTIQSIRYGGATTVGLKYEANKSVIWAESHDTYMNESSAYASDKSIARAWAMVANTTDAAALFYARPYDSSVILENDTDGTLNSKLSSITMATMGECSTYEWACDEVAAINHFNNRFSTKTAHQSTEGNIMKVERGDGIILVNMSGAGSVNVSTSIPSGTYKDEVSGKTFTVSGGKVSGEITSEYGVAVIYKNTMPHVTVNRPVKLSASVGTGSKFYSDGLEVTISEEYATTASYKLSTGETGSFSGSKTIVVGSGLKKGETVTLKITGTNEKGTKTAEYTYTKDEYDVSSCVFFKNTNNWSSVTAFMWSSKEHNEGWPGAQMFCYDKENNIWAVEVDKDYENVIFSNNGNSQTKDLTNAGIGYMYDPSTNSWSEYNVSVKKPSISTTQDSTTFSGTLNVTYTVKNAKSATIEVNGNKSSFSSSKTIAVTGTTTVKVTATGEDGTAVSKTYTYTKTAKVPTVSVSPATGTTFTDTIDVTVKATDATTSYYQIGSASKVAFTGTKTVTIGKDLKVGDSVKVTVTATNSDGSATPATATYTKKEQAKGYNVYLDSSACSWFSSDKAVAAYKTADGYKAMDTFTNSDKKTLAYVTVDNDTTSITIARLLPSGKYYNEKTVSVSASKNLITADSNWSNPSTAKYTGSVPGGETVKNGIVTEDGVMYYYVNNVKKYAGLIKIDDAYYYVNNKGQVVTGSYYVTKNNGLLPSVTYVFGTDGKMKGKNGINKSSNGKLYFYVNGVKKCIGMFMIGDDYYYANSSGLIATGSYYTTNNNGLLAAGRYNFATDGKLLKTGLFTESGVTYYYKDGVKTYAGLIKVGNDYYYVNSSAIVVKNKTYTISKTNSLLPTGTYTFDEDGKIVF